VTVVPLHPDEAPNFERPLTVDPGEFARALDDAGAVLERAERSEDAFAHRAGSLADAVYDRSRADIVLAVATSALQRAAQSLQAVANMQV
jgi:flagellar hook-basal body complex protein FliE